MRKHGKIDYLGTVSKSEKLQARKGISYSFVLGWGGVCSTISAGNYMHPIKVLVKNEKRQ